MKKIIRLYCILAVASFTTTTIQAQTTIGGDGEPASGAILHLKQDEGIIANSKGGLGMPRVAITDLGKLYPMFVNDSDYTDNTAGKQDTENAAHIGLAVYNVNEDLCATIPIVKGLYVWTGNNWQMIGSDERSAVVKTWSDPRDGNSYPYRSFATAGEWMLENMSYIDPSFDFFQAGDGSNPNKTTLRRYFYPQPDGNETNVNNIPTWSKPLGLLYSYAAATMGANDGITAQNGNNPSETKVQGVCPPGWHLPTDYEWSQLEEELAKHPEKYSTTATATPWRDRLAGSAATGTNDDYEQVNWRSTTGTTGHGATMQSPCAISGTPSHITPIGTSHRASMGGFATLLTGVVQGGAINAVGYGSTSYFSTASTVNSDTGWIRQVQSNPNQVVNSQRVYRIQSARWAGTSVRCKKD